MFAAEIPPIQRVTMFHKFFILLIAGSVLLLGSCGKTETARGDHGHDHGDHAGHDHDHGDAAATDALLSTKAIEGGQKVELGCAKCIYDLEGAEGCETAVKIDDKVLMLSGFEVDAHKVGLCKSAKAAEAAGAIEGDNFVATAVRLMAEAAPVATPAEPAAE